MSAKRNLGRIAAAVVIVALVGLLAFLLGRQVGLERAAPPIEELTIERVELPAPGRIRVHVVNGGQDPVTIHQVAIDDAIWVFSIEPDATIGRLRGATLEIPYPWVEGEAHEIVLISRNGMTFEAPIEVATETPQATFGWFWAGGATTSAPRGWAVSRPRP